MNKSTLIDHLNDDLSNELAAIIQYMTYAAKANGPYRPQLKDFYMAEVPDEEGHAQFLANKIVALGGDPVMTPATVAKADNNQDMLKAVLQAERRAIDGYAQRVKEAKEFGDIGLAVQLEDIVADETNHAEETARILRDWDLS